MYLSKDKELFSQENNSLIKIKSINMVRLFIIFHQISSVKESGMTVHLIAKAQQQAENLTNTNAQINNQNNQQQNIQTTSNNQQNNQSQQNVPSNPFANLMGMFGSMGGPQSATINVTNLNGLESSLNGILGGLGIRINSQPNQGNLNQPSNQQNQNVFQTPPNNNARRH